MDNDESTSYKVRLESFEGPLDLLLYLIKNEEVDISEVSIESITGQYLEYIENYRNLNIELASEFVVMAAHLMYLKSRSMLPKQELQPTDDLETDDPRFELIRQLIEYKKFKDAAEHLQVKEIDQENYFPNQPEYKLPLEPDVSIQKQEASVTDLIDSFQSILSRFSNEEADGLITDDAYTVSEKMKYLLQAIPTGETQSFTSIILKSSTKLEAIVTFLALLELIKTDYFSIVQDRNLAEITIYRLLHSEQTVH